MKQVGRTCEDFRQGLQSTQSHVNFLLLRFLKSCEKIKPVKLLSKSKNVTLKVENSIFVCRSNEKRSKSCDVTI